MKNLTTIFTTNKTIQDLYETFSVSIKSIMGLNEDPDGSITNDGKYRFILFLGTDVRAKYESSEWDEILGTGKSQKITPDE